MDNIPPELLNDLSQRDRNQVAIWWAGLDETARSEVVNLCDPRRDRCFFGITSDDSVPVPQVIGGRFLPSDDAAGWAEWHAELFDYLAANPELVVFGPPVVRTFHIGGNSEPSTSSAAA